MNLEELADEVIETDVLIVGGGLAGCMAAIKAREHNVEVTVIEKSSLRRGGSRGRGIDHFPSIAHTKLNGVRAEELGRMRAGIHAGLASEKLSIITAMEAAKPLVMLEDLGVKIRENDDTVIVQGGRVGTLKSGLGEGSEKQSVGDFLFYRGADVKLKLAEEVKRVGAKVYERTMLTSLITKDGSVIGATAVDIRNGKFLVFKSKATVISTGSAHRLYPSPMDSFPHNLFHDFYFPSNSGVHATSAYRAGAELTNMEYIYIHVTPGGVPWLGPTTFRAKMINSKGEDLTLKYPPRLSADKKAVEGGYPPTDTAFSPDPATAEIDRDVVMFDMPNLPEDPEPIVYRVSANGDPMVLSLMRYMGSLKRIPLEAHPWFSGIWRSFSGVLHDERGESSLKGLFIAGDSAGGIPGYGATGAFVWGWRCGDYAGEDAEKGAKPVFDAQQIKQVQAEKERALAPLKRKEGMNPMEHVNPLELEDMARKIMGHYVGVKKVEPRLKRALELLKVLREEFVPALIAKNPHELMRALEVQEIIDVAELHTTASLIRKESRVPPYHYRMDYPERDEVNWRKNIILKNVAGVMETDIVEPRE